MDSSSSGSEYLRGEEEESDLGMGSGMSVPSGDLPRNNQVGTM